MARTDIDNLGLVIVAALDALQQQGLDLADTEDDRALEQTTAIIYGQLLADSTTRGSALPEKRKLALAEALKIRKLVANRKRSEDDG